MRFPKRPKLSDLLNVSKNKTKILICKNEVENKAALPALRKYYTESQLS